MNERGEKIYALIPLDTDGYLAQWESEHAANLRTRLSVDFTAWADSPDKTAEQLTLLTRALRSDARARESAPRQKA